MISHIPWVIDQAGMPLELLRDLRMPVEIVIGGSQRMRTAPVLRHGRCAERSRENHDSESGHGLFELMPLHFPSSFFLCGRSYTVAALAVFCSPRCKMQREYALRIS
jgi:hypothetical protein